jgi:hypothetical protein
MLLVTAATAMAMPAFAAPRTEAGSFGDLAWEATSKIVGVTSTGTVAAGGDPRYFATAPKYSGTVALLMDYGGGQVFICSGSLMADRVSILTAAHCVSDGAGTAGPLSTRAFFYGGNGGQSSNPDFLPTLNGVTRNISGTIVNDQYTGSVIDHNDIAVLRMDRAAPSWATSYELSEFTDLTGVDFNVAGYGGRSGTGGNFGVEFGTGRLRQGDNTMNWRVGDAQFAGTTYGIFGPQSRTEFSYLSDFDNGLAANDASCRFAGASNFAALGIAGTAKFCNLGRGANEVSVAGGDSGGPQFDQFGRVMSVTSYGITFGTNFGDIRSGLNSSFGEMNGFVPVYIHKDFIAGAMAVPEPSSWAMLIAGFGLVGATARRRRSVATAA